MLRTRTPVLSLLSRAVRCKGLPVLQFPRRTVQVLQYSSRTNKTNAVHVPRAPGKKTSLPERLLIFHAGTGRTVFLGCMKITTIFVFSFFCLVVGPTHFFADDQPKWVAGAVVLSGIVPMIAVAYLTSPFVTYMHLRIPPFARTSRELLIRFSKALPKDAEIDITTMNFIGKPRVSRIKVADLYSANERFGIVNLRRKLKVVEGPRKRPWWMGKLPTAFGVHGGKGKIMGGEVWENVKKGIEKRKS